MSGQITGNAGITPQQHHSTNSTDPSQKLTASRPEAVNRNSITTSYPGKNLATGQPSHPTPTPLANRRAAIKPNNPDSLLNLFKKGVDHTSKQVENFNSKPPGDRKEKKLQTQKMKDSLKHMKKLETVIKNQFKDVALEHNKAEFTAFNTIETPENKALYEKASNILNTLRKNIKALKKAMR